MVSPPSVWRDHLPQRRSSRSTPSDNPGTSALCAAGCSNRCFGGANPGVVWVRKTRYSQLASHGAARFVHFRCTDFS